MSQTPLVRSAHVRALCLGAALATLAIRFWMSTLADVDLRGLSPIFTHLFLHRDDGDYDAAGLAVLILVAAALFPVRVWAERFCRWIGCHPAWVALAVVVLFAAGARFIYRDLPLSMDEYAASFQSRIFAAGALHGRFPPELLSLLLPNGFQGFFINASATTGGVASAYWPGFALLLTPFAWIGMPWLCNPMLSGATILVVHRLARELFDSVEAAGMAMLLTLASPVFFADGISYYSMTGHLLANALFALLLIRPTAWRAWAAGIVGSIALVLHNPVPHLLFALPWLAWLALRPDRWRLLGAIVLGYLPLVAVLGVGWFLYSSQLVHAAQAAAAGSAGSWGRLHGQLSFFTPPTGALWIARAIGLAKLWIWAVPGLVVLAEAGLWRSRHQATALLLASSLLLTFIGYLFVPVDQGHGWGFRYLHSAWVALPLLATAALYRTRSATTEANRPADDATRQFVIVCALLSIGIGVGYRAHQIQDYIDRHLAQLPHHSVVGPHVVFIEGRFGYYALDLVQNDPWLRGDEVRLASQGVEGDARVIARFFPGYQRVYGDRYGTVWSAPGRTDLQR